MVSSVKRFFISFLTIITILGTVCTSFSFADTTGSITTFPFPEPYCSDYSGYVAGVSANGYASLYVWSIVPYVNNSSDPAITVSDFPVAVTATFNDDDAGFTLNFSIISLKYDSIPSYRVDLYYYDCTSSGVVSATHINSFALGALSTSRSYVSSGVRTKGYFVKGGSLLRIDNLTNVCSIAFSDSGSIGVNSLYNLVSSQSALINSSIVSVRSSLESGLASLSSSIVSGFSTLHTDSSNLYERLNNLNNWLVGNYFSSLSNWWSRLFSDLESSGSESTDSLPSDSVSDLESESSSLDSHTDISSDISSIGSSTTSSISTFSSGFSAIWGVVDDLLSSSPYLFSAVTFCLALGFVSMVFRRS